MSRKLITVIPGLQEDHRRRIAEAAARHGLEALFFARDEDAAAELADAEIVFSQSVYPAARAPRLRWQCTPSAGVDHFCRPGLFLSKEAVLTSSSGAYGVTIAEHIVMVTLEMLRRQQDYNRIVAARVWRRDLPIRSIHGCRAALLGTGDIGRETARRLRGFAPACIIGVNRTGHAAGEDFDRTAAVDGLDAVLPETDLLVISLPGTAQTRQLLDRRRLSLLPDGALIVNVGRGAVIEQAALEEELRAGRLLAALDVFEEEPIPADSPLWDCPNLLITPHVAGNMTLPWTQERILELFLENLENYCAGRPLQRVADLQRGY